MIQAFENRYDAAYLELLANKLSFDTLKSSALEIEREEQQKKFTPKGQQEPITLTKVIKIEFCGLAAGTLLGGNDIEEERREIEKIYPKDAARILNLRKEIRDKFEYLFSGRALEELNNGGIYLLIRFCFPYLYADFPISLMRAEDSLIWNAKLDHEVGFSENDPVSPGEWELSNVKAAQIASLEEIVKLCRQYEDFRQMTDYDMAVNTCETRFAVIPIPTCILIINDIAISDSYIYAKVTKEKRLLFNTPVNVTQRYLPGMPRKKENEAMSFQLLRQHFLYLWRHDLTMFADMATKFREYRPEGLLEIEPPMTDSGKPKPAIDWEIKIDRIVAKKRRNNNEYDRKAPEEEERIEVWRANVIKKMKLSTNKILQRTIKLDQSKLEIKIDRKLLKYHVTITYNKRVIFVFDKKGENSILFSAITHFAYAKLKGLTPLMYTNFKGKGELRRQITEQLGARKRIKDESIDADSLFDNLFRTSNHSGWEFLLPQENITLNEKYLHYFQRVTYPVDGKNVGCLDGLI